ncbi:MAG: nitrite reductase (NAD(P)H) small subunit [Chitinophagales bacterium]|nr:nitrite reductase (NAD(P)H) small subunit [Chitinophagales bacterium]
MNYMEVCSLSDLPAQSQKIVTVGSVKVALFHYNNQITAMGNACLHKAGPLGMGNVDFRYGDWYVVCPWHGWEYRIKDGGAPPGSHDQQAMYEVKVEDGKILLSEKPVVKAKRAEHAEKPLLDLEKLMYQTTPDSLNVLGISTTNLNESLPRFSTSENALEKALDYAKTEYGAATRIIKLRDLKFRHCEGFYSQHENACTWPCSISEMDPHDGMNEVYRAMVLWADVLLVASPIRWGNASSLYFKMAERLNCVQNQITLKNRVLIKNKVASFIITGGQDNIQQVAAQLMCFYTDLGFTFPPFSFLGWSRGWTAEDMDRNIAQFQKSKYIDRGVKELVDNCVCLSRQIKEKPVVKMNTPLPKIEEAPGMAEDDYRDEEQMRLDHIS